MVIRLEERGSQQPLMKSLFLLNAGQLEGEFGNAKRQRFDAGWGEPCGGKKARGVGPVTWGRKSKEAKETSFSI
jgi:hypothetical protein